MTTEAGLVVELIISSFGGRLMVKIGGVKVVIGLIDVCLIEAKKRMWKF